MDGRFITDRNGFFCAIGEAVNGPGGYFGSDLDGLADCLRGGFGAAPPFALTWLGFDLSERHLSFEFLEAVLAVLDGGGVSVQPSYGG
ncbi:barstar family protein [Nocardia asteroides]|uniref:barstar family protein n=1 Tax=Nocardia asteroides TaxID=1824 RepID=UPI001E2CB33F|nr:barstar family protein [Nocardia asteroides]UGT65268.1 barstar family protein [Nocardia asteroides]